MYLCFVDHQQTIFFYDQSVFNALLNDVLKCRYAYHP